MQLPAIALALVVLVVLVHAQAPANSPRSLRTRSGLPDNQVPDTMYKVLEVIPTIEAMEWDEAGGWFKKRCRNVTCSIVTDEPACAQLVTQAVPYWLKSNASATNTETVNGELVVSYKDFAYTVQKGDAFYGKCGTSQSSAKFTVKDCKNVGNRYKCGESDGKKKK